MYYFFFFLLIFIYIYFCILGAVGRPMPWVDVCIAKANVYAKYGYNVIAQGNSSYTQITPGKDFVVHSLHTCVDEAQWPS